MSWFLGDLVERNISKKVLFSICMVGISLMILDFLFSLISEISDLTDSYSLYDAFIYSFFLIPVSLNEYLTYISLLGVLIGLGSLKEEGEMIATKTLGKSDLRILLASLRPALLVILVGFIFQETKLPTLSQANEEERLIKQKRISIEDGYWFASDSAISHFKSSPNRESIIEIQIFELDEDWDIERIINSESATKDGSIWTLNNPEIISVRGGYKTSESSLIWNGAPTQKDMRRILSPKYLSIVELKGTIEDEVSEYKKNNLSLEFWRKIFHPISSIMLIFLASSFIFSQVRDQNLGQRLLGGVIFAFSFDVAQNLFESMAVVSFLEPFIAVILPIIIVFILTIIIWRWRPS